MPDKILEEIKNKIQENTSSTFFGYNDEDIRKLWIIDAKTVIIDYLNLGLLDHTKYDFEFICDETNNTPLVLDNGLLLGNIIVKELSPNGGYFIWEFSNKKTTESLRTIWKRYMLGENEK